jgi:hypothetical protein
LEVLFNRGTSTPRKVSGNLARIAFHGEGEARFRLQHTRDAGGKPDELSWVDVSGMSDGLLGSPLDELEGIKPGMTTLPPRYIGAVRRPVLVDRVNGEADVLYRRHIAEWLRIIPLDVAQGNGGCCHPCGAYRVTMDEADGRA